MPEKKVGKKNQDRWSGIDVHTYRSMQNLKYGDVRDLPPVVWKGFIYI